MGDKQACETDRFVAELLADEPVASLDASIRGEILALMRSFVDSHGVSIIAVTHDLGLARYISDRVVFLADGRVEMDSNPVENRIRPLALGRKNFLFCGHDEGGRSWARVASLIETCKLCKVDPLGYLTTTLEAIANGHPKSRLDELLPGPFATASS